MCSGPKESVETLKWLLEIMPHLKSQEIFMLENVRKHKLMHKGLGILLNFCKHKGAILFLSHMARKGYMNHYLLAVIPRFYSTKNN